MNQTVAPLTESAVLALAARQRAFYDQPSIDARIAQLIRQAPDQNLPEAQLITMLRATRALYFDCHVQVVSGHHTGLYLRFESIARAPDSITVIASSMADWIRRTFPASPPTGIVTTSSDARLLALRTADLLTDLPGFQVVLTPFDYQSGKIGTDVVQGAIETGKSYLALNDVTTRGMCVSKLGKVVTDRRGRLAGMMVFARRDSGQFPLMDELTATHPFYISADLNLPQWEPAQCPLCTAQEPLWQWSRLPEL
ncbi:hypothetical protein FBQ96_08960 [Nitrospirales bacterium NOB]|nr:hypothetical protein [Nitrospirota bacterium]MCE7964475.1 hypothetical protein [Nitrospira sp. NTP2]MCK6492411.1 hypothetical protein [Nitrospira sp.]MDL1889692.1 hypothetical protein [Nitrospirales bacterium NOB]MEB2340064.1 hypothetical protein [Nitrospirales bacterium]